MSEIRDTIWIRIGLDEKLPEREKERLVGLIAEEMEFGDLRDNRYNKTGWGMGTSRVVKIIRYHPKATQHPGRERDFELKGMGFNGALSPDNPVTGRFILRGQISKGLKNVIGRTVQAHLTMKQAVSLRDDLSRWIKEYPDTGTNPETNEDEEGEV